MNLIERIHAGYVHGRRVRVLSERLASLIPQGSRVLDVGSGDGRIAWLIGQARPDLEIKGLDVLVREGSYIPIQPFDGRCLPYDDCSFDVVMFVDVLHHADDPDFLLREAARVARNSVLIKDHTLRGAFARSTLRFMDWVGNRRHDVSLPYNYWRPQQWSDAFQVCRLCVDSWQERLQLYTWPASLVFDRSLQFVARLSPERRVSRLP